MKEGAKMKKTISIILICSTMLIAMSSFVSFGLITNDSTYNSCDEIQANIEENINNYFLPAAYDVSPYTVLYGNYWDEIDAFNCQSFYEDSVVRDEKGNIIVPPIYTLVVSEDILSVDPYEASVFEAAYEIYNKNNKNGVSMSPSMWRVLHSTASLESVVNAYLAPWALNNQGKLYTWVEIMAMSDDEINMLDFESYEFYSFISGVKEALVKRDWWKDEYNERYELLASHKDDYRNIQPENEIVSVDGENIYLSRINQEYSGGNSQSLNSIISANIYSEKFADALSNIDSGVKEKYSVLIEAIENEWETNRRDIAVDAGNENYMKYIISETPPKEYALQSVLNILANYIDGNDEYNNYYGLEVFTILENGKYTSEELRRIFEEFNYIISTEGAFNFELVDTVINNTAKQNIDDFAFDTSIVLSYEKASIIPWWRFAVQEVSPNHDIIYPELAYVEDFDRLIKRLEYLHDNYTPDKYKEMFKNNIEFVREYAKNNGHPTTGDNSVLYVIIAASALVTMSAMVVRRKRRIEE